MAKIVFVQRLFHEYPGIEFISAVLKKGGHQVDILIGEHPQKIVKQLHGADIVAFSVMTGMQQWALSVAGFIKRYKNILTVFGGPHPTYFPEFINEESVDIICRGEGELALLELADASDKQSDICNIKNLWIKKDGVIYRNNLRPLVPNLDDLPFPDRLLYYNKYKFLRNDPHKVFLVGRGCPFDCNFCFNETLKKMYVGLGCYVRMRGPENIISEVEMVKRYSPLKTILFSDDIFTFSKIWLKKFTPLYRRKVNIPFYAATRADVLDEEVVSLLSEAGCRCVAFAIESGNQKIRNTVLNKQIANDAIILSAGLLKKYKIKFTTYNMVGIPGETIENIFETIDLNITIGTNYPRCSLLTPYPGTKIAEYAQSNGYIDGDPKMISASSQQSETIIKCDDKDSVVNLHLFFQTMVLFPWSINVIKRLIKLRPNIFFKAWWMIVYFFVFVRSEGRSFVNMLIFSLRSWRSFVRK